MAWTAFVTPALVGAASIAMSLCLALPAAGPGHPATLLLLPGQQQTALAALTSLDPEVRLLASRAGGLLLTVVYERADLAAHLTGTGVIAAVGGGSIGCHSSL